MRARRWIGVLAMIGVLLHVVAVVRHGTMVLASIGSGDLLADMTVICHAGADTPAVPAGGDDAARKLCPICSGLVATYGLPLVGIALRPVQAPSIRVRFALHDQRFELAKRIRPPGRGPPLAA